MTGNAGWADRFRAARKAAGFSSSEKFAAHIGAARRTALRWETGEAYPRAYAERIAEVSPEFATLMAELPPESVQVDAPLAARVREIERAREELVAAVEALAEGLDAVERRIAQLERQRRSAARSIE